MGRTLQLTMFTLSISLISFGGDATAQAGAEIDGIMLGLGSNDRQARQTALDQFFKLQADPARFNKCLPEEDVRKLIPLVQSKDRQTSFIGIYLTILTASRPSPAFVTDMLDALKDAELGPTEGILASVGFFPAVPLDKGKLERIIQSTPGHSAEVQAGLISYYLRCGGNIDLVMKSLNTGEKSALYPNENYWLYYTGAPMQRAEPAVWKKYWIENSQPERLSVRQILLSNLCAAPGAPEAGYIVEQAIGVPDLQDDLMRVLWELRANGPSFSNVKGLKDWLSGMKKGNRPGIPSRVPKDIFQEATASALLAYIFGDKAQFNDFVTALKRDKDPILNTWSNIVEYLLESDSSNALLDEFRTAMLTAKRVQSGIDWFVWILDLRRGKNPGPPPIESLSDVLRTPQASVAIESLRSGEKAVLPWLVKIRDPYVFLRGSDSSSSNVMMLLGVLDRLEKSREQK